MKKRIISMLLMVCMLASLVPVTASAASSGKCGDNAYWSLDAASGTLTVSGTGATYDYEAGETPWNNSVSKLDVKEGISSIGNYFMAGQLSLEEVVIPAGVTRIGSGAFIGCTNLKAVKFDGNAPAVVKAGDSLSSFDNTVTFYCCEGNTGWTDSEYYDAVSGRWNGYNLSTWSGSGEQSGTTVLVFSDVNVGDWFYDTVYAAAAAGLVAGKPDGTYAPMESLSWAQTVTFAVRVAQYKAGEHIYGAGDQTGQNWYDVYVIYALEHGLISYVPTSPNAIVNRGEAAVIFAAALGEEEKINEVPEGYFSDVPSSGAVYEAIMKLAEAGICNGKGNGLFGLNDTFKRSEVATIVARMIDPSLRQILEIEKEEEPYVTLSSAELELSLGESAVLTATVLPETAPNKTVTWSSDNSSVATVDANGLVTAVAPGSAVIKATAANGASATCTVTVSEVKVNSVTLSSISVELFVGDSCTVTATANPENASNKTLTWTSDNTAVATVDANGVITAVAPGTAVITATAVSGVSASCVVTVSQIEVSSVTVKSTATDLSVGCGYQFTAEVEPENAADKSVTWSVSNSSLATIDSNGWLVAKAAGTVTVTATASNGVSGSLTVTISGGRKNAAEQLADFILQNGYSNNNGGKTIKYSLDSATWYIAYKSGESCMSFIMAMYTDSGTEYVTFEYDIKNMKAYNNRIEYLSTLDFTGTAYFDISTYYSGKTLYFTIDGFLNIDLTQQLCNVAVQAAVEGWQLLLIKQGTGLTLNDLGFKSFS